MTDNIYINAHINNISFPKTIEELEYFIYERGKYNVEDVINESNGGYTIWTVPRSSVVGDIVLYFHAKTAIQWISKLENELKYLDSQIHDIQVLSNWLMRARKLYSLYGGKIFAIGRINSQPEIEELEDGCLHWRGRIYAKVEDIIVLETPISISEFNDFIFVSRQSAITSLPSNEYERLKAIIVSKNDILPSYFLSSRIGNFSLANSNIENFLEITRPYRKRFLLESNFRSYYVDNILKVLSGKKFYSECQCHTELSPLSRVDNVFEFEDRRFLLEVKLNIQLENDLPGQLDKYILADYIYLNKNCTNLIQEFINKYMFVIDMYGVYKYDVESRLLTKVINLDEIACNEDIIRLFSGVINDD